MVTPRAAMWSFSSSGLAPNARAEAIVALRERGILPLEPLADHLPQADIVKWRLPAAAILIGTLGGLRQIAPADAPDMADEAILGVNLSGASVVCARHRQSVVNDGDGVLFSSVDEGFIVNRPSLVSFLGLRLPRKMLARIAPNLDDVAERVIPGQSSVLKLLTTYVRCLDPKSISASPDLGWAVSTHIHDLVALAIGPHSDVAALVRDRGARAARLQVIKADISRHVGDGGLSVTAVATRHGVSKRYIHKLFETEDATFSEFVLNRRLATAYRFLTDPRAAHRSVTTIAFEAGFGDLSWFNRAFRRRYDATPTDVRQHAVSSLRTPPSDDRD